MLPGTREMYNVNGFRCCSVGFRGYLGGFVASCDISDKEFASTFAAMSRKPPGTTSWDCMSKGRKDMRMTASCSYVVREQEGGSWRPNLYVKSGVWIRKVMCYMHVKISHRLPGAPRTRWQFKAHPLLPQSYLLDRLQWIVFEGGEAVGLLARIAVVVAEILGTSSLCETTKWTKAPSVKWILLSPKNTAENLVIKL